MWHPSDKMLLENSFCREYPSKIQISYCEHYELHDNPPRPMHSHRGAELVLFTAGQCETRLETGQVFLCRPNMVLVTPPGLKHIQYAHMPSCETYCAVFEESEGTMDLTPRLIPLHGETRIQRWFIDLYELCRDHEFDQASLVLTAILLRLIRLEIPHVNTMHPVLKQVLMRIFRHYGDDLSIAELASQCNASVSLVNQLFRKQFGMGPRRFLIAVRMREARAALLNPEFTISDVAQRTGFVEANYFIRQFKAFHGITPGRYRSAPIDFSDRIRFTEHLFDFSAAFPAEFKNLNEQKLNGVKE